MPHITRLCDYQAPDYRVIHQELRFELYDGYTLVHHTQQIRRCEESSCNTLLLNGEDLELLELSVNGKLHDYTYKDNILCIEDLPMVLTLRTTVNLKPHENTQLSGLYLSKGTYCTQCEAQGFRRISFSLDRPDVLSTYYVRIEADKARYPVLLSNGNQDDCGDLPHGRHYVCWRDPFPKPTYLFALVAGDLQFIETTHRTPAKKDIRLRVYTRKDDLDEAHFALRSLKEALRWDEVRFHLKCDLQTYNVVSIDDFNMGAMENKGLNIFNSQCVLATPETASDAEQQNVQAVIGHEYFHNWTGNRITCRDWFQLSLKEGLTVFREQEFSRDMNDADLIRLQQIAYLRREQFAEDAGLTAHPVQPQSYISIDNFYTTTVYEKGAEIIRMMHTLIGEDAFQAGMRRYIHHFDGQAATIEDFARCMEEASGYPFTGDFFRWYTTMHTPEISVSLRFDPQDHSSHLTVRQNLKAVDPPQALVIPLRFGMLNAQGEPYHFAGGSQELLLTVSEAEQHWRFPNTEPGMIPELLHDLSAPVKCFYPYTLAELLVLARHSTNIFIRHEAISQLQHMLLEYACRNEDDKLKELLEDVAQLQSFIVQDQSLSAAIRAHLLRWPDLASFMARGIGNDDLDTFFIAHVRVKRLLGLKLRHALALVLEREIPRSAAYSPEDAGIRSLHSMILDYYGVCDDPNQRHALFERYQRAQNMSERLSCLHALNRRDDALRQAAMQDFYQRYQHKALIIDKWFALQAQYCGDNALNRIAALSRHPDFTLDNPNRVRALLSTFARKNPVVFHDRSGSGYRLLCHMIAEISPRNQQLAARLLNVFSNKKQLDASRQAQIDAALHSLPKQVPEVEELLMKLSQ